MSKLTKQQQHSQRYNAKLNAEYPHALPMYQLLRYRIDPQVKKTMEACNQRYKKTPKGKKAVKRCRAAYFKRHHLARRMFDTLKYIAIKENRYQSLPEGRPVEIAKEYL